MTHLFTNRLAEESSPYLLQHAHNPVDWFPWGEEAFARARDEDKPVLVSIGYAACHWCHVMERESFENEETAALMNAHFVNIKVDREERPDIDHIFMDAVQAISGSGGWPLNVFLTPEGKPFYGGTYFPPRPAFNRASWPDLLVAISTAWRDKREELTMQADNLTQHLKVSNDFGATSKEFVAGMDKIDEAFSAIMKAADRVWGGFGQAPKFPQTFTISFLLRYAHITGNTEARDQALLSLDKMIAGGIYDHIGGGFARYSTDTEWLAPHFEKMLYDNALLVSTLSEAFAFSGEVRYRKAIEETITFVQRELMHPDGGFYSALDADSEGVEGKFYVWERSEVEAILGGEADLFCRYYDIREGGNWEGKSIPRILQPLEVFAGENGLDSRQLEERLEKGKRLLLEQREKRVRPGLDDKVLLGWNALMNKALSDAAAVTGEPRYQDLARKNMQFLLARFKAANGTLFHTWKGGRAHQYAFLDDYSYLIDALLRLSEITAETEWLEKAADLTGVVLQYFRDEQSPYFLYTPDFQTDILLRKKEVYDGATPSGNAVMAASLYHLSILMDRREWRQVAEEAVMALAEVVVRYPTSFGVWLSVLTELIYGTKELAVIGPEYKKLGQELHRLYIPFSVSMSVEKASGSYPLISGRKTGEQTLIFLCQNYACQQPVSSLETLKSLMFTNNLNTIQ